MSKRRLSLNVERQIQRATDQLSRDVSSLLKRADISAANVSSMFAQLAQHSSSIDAHRIREIVLDVINENLLSNAAFELYEDEDGSLTFKDWEIYNELGEFAQLTFDPSKKKYGSGSIKLSGSNPLGQEDKSIYLSQELIRPWIEDGIYTVALYYTNDPIYSTSFDIIVRVRIHSADGELIQESTYADGSITPISSDHVNSDGFIRSYFSFMMPKGAYTVNFDVGMKVKVGCEAILWIDYPTLQTGIVPTQPSPVVEGIITVDHISTKGLTADVIKAGVLDTGKVTVSSPTGAITMKDERIVIDSKQHMGPEVIIGALGNDNFGIQAGGTVLNQGGISIHDGEIKLGDDGTGQPLFEVTRAGTFLARRGKIANFTIQDDLLEAVAEDHTKMSLNAITASITLQPDKDYATIIRPGGIFGRAPIAKIAAFDAEHGSSDYYVIIERVYDSAKTYVQDKDYSYNKVTGEIIKRRGSLMPDVVSVDYRIVDARSGFVFETEGTAVVTFTVKERASAIITEDSLLDASFVRNLIVGSAQIEYGSITSLHVKELVGDVLKGGKLQSLNWSRFTGSEYDLDGGSFRLGGWENPALEFDATTRRLVLRGTMVQSGSGDTYPIPVFRGAYNESTEYFRGDVVTYDGSTWIYVNEESSVGILPEPGPYWEVYAKRGDSAEPIELILLRASNQVFQVNSDGVASPNYITLTAHVRNILDNEIEWTVDKPDVVLVENPNDARERYLYYSAMGEHDSVKVTVSARGITDTVTIVKVKDGVDGEDAYTVFLTNESHTYAANSSGAVSDLSSGASEVRVYRGAQQLTYTTGTLSNGHYTVTLKSQQGISGSLSAVLNNCRYTPISFSSDQGVVVLEITARYNNIDTTFEKTIVYSKSKAGPKGDKGDPGADGLSVVEVLIYRRASATPAKPSGGTFNFSTQTLTPPSGWSAGIPSGADPVWVSVGIASTQGSSGTANITWSDPVKAFADGKDGKDGADGQHGQSVNMIFRRSTSQPETPAASSEIPTGWYDNAGSATGSGLLYSSVGTRTSPTSNWVWQKPILVEGQKGADGADAKLLYLVADSEVFKVSKTGTVTPSSITLTAHLQNVSGTVTWSTEPTVTLIGSGNSRTLSATNMGSNEKVKITASLNGLTDTVTIVKVADGDDGKDGNPAKLLRLVADTQVIKVNKDGTPSPESVTITAHCQNISGEVQWIIEPEIEVASEDESYFLTPFSFGDAGDSITITADSFGNHTEVKVTAMLEGLTDVITITKVADGADGPGIVYVGDFEPGKTYHYTSVRRDVVTYQGAPYLFNVPTGTNGTSVDSWNYNQWLPFGLTVESVATDLLLTDYASIRTGLYVGKGIGANTAGISGEGTAPTDVRIWAGGSRETAPFRVLEDGTLYATKGHFSGDITGATGTFEGTLSAKTITAEHYAEIRNTWTDGDVEPIAPGKDIEFDFYIPHEASRIVSIKLSAKATRFRAYATGASSGGGEVVTSEQTGSHDHLLTAYTPTIETTKVTVLGYTDKDGEHSHSHSLGVSISESKARTVTDLLLTSSGSHSHSISVSVSSSSHSHGITIDDSPAGGLHSHSATISSSSHSHSASGSSGSAGSHAGHVSGITYGSHDHSVSGSITGSISTTNSSHRHFFESNLHNHTVTVPLVGHPMTERGEHSHTVTIPNHVHGLVYGIYESTTPANVKLYCRDSGSGTNWVGPISLNSAPDSSTPYVLCTNLDITDKFSLSGDRWKTIRFTSTRLGRINYRLVIKVDVTA